MTCERNCCKVTTVFLLMPQSVLFHVLHCCQVRVVPAVTLIGLYVALQSWNWRLPLSGFLHLRQAVPVGAGPRGDAHGLPALG